MRQQYYGPDYELNVRPSNMENANSPEYLEKIKNAVIENLKKTIPAPSVQMQDVPRHGLHVMSDEDEAALDDEDDDNNPDVRLTQRGFDKRVVADNEFEDSDDEEMAEANGVFRPNGKKKGIQDYKNPYAQEEESKQPTPEPEVPALSSEKAVNDEGDETMEDVEAQTHEATEVEHQAPEAEPAPQDAAPTAVAQVDTDGDVDMAEAVEPEVVPSIKKEEAEVQPTPAAAELSPATENHQANEKPAGEPVQDDTPAQAVAEPATAVADSASPAAEGKETDKTEQEKVTSPAKPAEATDDSVAKMDVDETPKAESAEQTAPAHSGEASAEN